MATHFDNDRGIKFIISLRFERPVEGCELAPHASLYIKGGSMDNQTRAKMLDANPHYFSFKWRRSPRKPVCENESCPRRETFEPMHWSSYALGGPCLRCALCEKAGVPKHESTFCSKSCLQHSWKSHTASKHNMAYCQAMAQYSSFRVHKGSQGSDTTAPITEADTNSGSGALMTRTHSHTSEASLVLDGDGPVGSIPEPATASPVSVADWELVSTEQVYTPSAGDVGCTLMIEAQAMATNGGAALSDAIAMFSEPVLSSPRPPPKRPLVTVPGANAGSSGLRFRVLSYNVLAEQYATKQAYPYCDSWALSWSYRWSVLMQELAEAQADIICLQEVQSDHFEAHISPFMHELGYDGTFKQKTRESMGQYGKVDGCATFWRVSKFAMVESYAIEFNDFVRHSAAELGLDEAEGRRYMNRLLRDNVAQIIILESQAARTSRVSRQSSQVCVVNTHLYSNHLRPDVKLWQTCMLMRELEQIVMQNDIALLLCGDFNSEPDSAVYELISEGAINRVHPELENLTDDAVRVLPDLDTISQSLDLASAMTAALGNEPEYTNFTGKFRGTLDYIYYSSSRLRIMAASNLPDPSELAMENGPAAGLPSVSYPSDHVMLCCDVAFTMSGTGALTRPMQQMSQQQQQQQQRKISMGAVLGGKGSRGGSGGGRSAVSGLGGGGQK